MFNSKNNDIVQRDGSLKILLIKDGLEHRLMKFSKKSLFWSLIIFPGTAILAFVFISVASLYFWSRLENKNIDESAEVLSLKKQNVDLQNEIGSLKSSFSEINNKLLSPSKEQNPLSLFLTSQGFKNLTSENKVVVENLSYVPLDNNTFRIKFELHNQSGEEKTKGYFYTFTHAANQMYIYPNSVDLSRGQLAYNDGESFNIGRFKIIEFETKFLKQGQVNLRIVIFSKTGDLLYNKILPLE
ncbi:MAG: hypothetical protein QE271_05765 [Bacteriovoracaceae bacterium]|nr:hypothetical protein [Bacteriovoracaceae bacterium]